MIDKLTYEEVLSISKGLREQSDIIEKLVEERNIPELLDFTATIEGYSKFLENTVEINKDADKALEGLKNQKKELSTRKFFYISK